MTAELTIEKGNYRHNKTGNIYQVLGVALHTETDKLLVVYAPQGASEHQLYVRPVGMFLESVEIDGKLVPRFEKVV